MLFQEGKGTHQLLFKVRLVSSVIGIKILLVNHHPDSFPVGQLFQLCQNILFGKEIEHNINGSMGYFADFQNFSLAEPVCQAVFYAVGSAGILLATVESQKTGNTIVRKGF